MTVATNGLDGPGGLQLCPKLSRDGRPCHKEANHVARCRFADSRVRVARKVKAARAAEVAEAATTKRLKVLIVGGDAEAREAAADFVRCFLAAVCRNVDSTFIGHPQGPAAGATALQGYRISIRDAGE